MAAAHEVPEQRCGVGIDAVIVAVDEVVGDQACEALRERSGRAAGGSVEVGLCETLAADRGGDSQGALIGLASIAVARLEELLVETALDGATLALVQLRCDRVCVLQVGRRLRRFSG